MTNNIISKVFDTFNNHNIILYNIFFTYLDNNSLFDLYHTNKELSKLKFF